MSFRVLTCASAAAVVMLAVAACSAGAPASSAKVSHPASAAPSVSAPATIPAQYTGAQLARARLPIADFPGGYLIVPKSPYDTGNQANFSSIYTPDTMTCADFVNHSNETGFGDSALANEVLQDASTKLEFGQEIRQFPGANVASQFVSGIVALAGRCRAFGVSESGVAVRSSMRASATGPVEGHEAVMVKVTGTTAAGGTVEVNGLYVLDGTYAFYVAAIGLDTAPPVTPSLSTLVAKLMARVAALGG